MTSIFSSETTRLIKIYVKNPSGFKGESFEQTWSLNKN